MQMKDIDKLITKLIMDTEQGCVLWKKASIIETNLGVAEKTLYIHNFEGHEFRLDEIHEFKQAKTTSLLLKLVVKGGSTTLLNTENQYQKELTQLRDLAYRQNPNPEDIIEAFLNKN